MIISRPRWPDLRASAVPGRRPLPQATPRWTPRRRIRNGQGAHVDARTHGPGEADTREGIGGAVGELQTEPEGPR